jgi:hypothetical protein
MKTLCFLPQTPTASINDLSVVVRASGSDFVHCKNEGEIFAESNGATPNSRLVLMTSQQQVDVARQFTERFPQSLIIMMITSPLPMQSRELRECIGIHSFVAYNNNEIDPCDLTVTLRKIRTKDVFGVQRYLKHDCLTSRHEICTPRDKLLALQRVEEFVRFLGGDNATSRFSQYSTRVSELLDELVLNAVAHTCNRSLQDAGCFEFSLSPTNSIHVEWGFDGELFGMSVRDNAGTLKKEDILTYLDSTMVLSAQNEEHMSHLAFRSMFERVHKFVVNVHPGFMTEVVSVMRFDRRLRDFDGRLRSFHFFTI